MNLSATLPRKGLLLFAFCFAFVSVFATPRGADSTHLVSGFSGGMFVHMGYQGGQNPDLPFNPKGANVGVGGVVKMHLGRWLRLGGEGYVSTLPTGMSNCRHLLQAGSYVRNGFGGFIVEAHFVVGTRSCARRTRTALPSTVGTRSQARPPSASSSARTANARTVRPHTRPQVEPYVGLGFGGGAKRSLFIVEGSQQDWQSEPLAFFNKQGYGYLMPYVGVDFVLTKRLHLSLKVDGMLAFARSGLLTPVGPKLSIGILFCH